MPLSVPKLAREVVDVRLTEPEPSVPIIPVKLKFSLESEIDEMAIFVELEIVFGPVAVKESV